MDHPESHISITSLPQELLDYILVHLSTEEISRLGRCNKHLRARLQVTLYGPHDTRNQASKWACENGAIDTLAIALSYGAAIDTVDVGTQPFRFKTFTLHLAAKHRQVDMFNYLISGGARVDDPAVKRTQVEAFVRCLCRPANANMMHCFLEAGLASDLCQYLKNMLLLGVLESSSPESMQEFGIDANVFLDSVRSLLDAGADPNHVQSLHRSEVSTSVLSAALLSHRPDLFRLLVERGADVNGVPSPGLNHHRLPLHVPVCAAAFIMAAAGEDTTLMQLCLDCGADINVYVPFTQEKYGGLIVAMDSGHHSVRMDHTRAQLVFLTSPLLLFVENIVDWGGIPGEPLDPEEKRHPNVIEKLQFLLDNGAKTPTVLEPEHEKCYRVPEPDEDSSYPYAKLHFRWYYHSRSPWSPFSLLMDKWAGGSHASAHPNLLLALKALIRHGALKHRTGAYIAHHDWYRPKYHGCYRIQKWYNTYHPAKVQDLSDRIIRTSDGSHSVSFWKDIMATIMENSDYHENIKSLLFEYVVAKKRFEVRSSGKMSDDIHKTLDNPDVDSTNTNDASFRETVAQLVRAGADINHPSRGYTGACHISGTMLHVLCHIPSLHDIRMLAILVREFHADATIVVHGKTAADVLRGKGNNAADMHRAEYFTSERGRRITEMGIEILEGPVSKE